jgi:hypothetical protein
MIRYIYKSFNNFFFKESIPNLGRWCNKSIPTCNDKVIERKMTMAIMDNDMGLSNLKFDNNKKISINNKKMTIQEYINYYYFL